MALKELEPVVKALTAADFPACEKNPIRLGVPVELDEAITHKKGELDQPYIRVLVTAARKWLAMRNS